MKVSTKVLTLMAALAAGSASAEYTQAGTSIENIATATFDNPTYDPSKPVDPTTNPQTSIENSNKVTTTVLALPDFDVIFKGDNPTDGGNQNSLSTTTGVRSGTLQSSGATTFVTAYTVKNDGNIVLKVDLEANTSGATGPQTITYYRDVNKDGQLDSGDTLLTDTNGNGKVDLSVAWDDPNTAVDEGLAEILQVVSINSGADPALVYGASPVGTVVGTGTGVGQNGYSNATNYEQAKPAGTDLQFTKVQLYSVAITPPPSSTPLTPGGTTYTPPAPVDVQVPTLGAGTTDPTINTPPVTTVKGYTDAAGTPIVTNPGGTVQTAYPKADNLDNNPDVVTFNNVISNTGSAPDTIQLFPADAVKADGTLNAGWTFNAATATFTYTNLGSVTTVQFLDPSGAVITTKTGALYPSFNLPAGSSVYYQTKVTYPDPDDSLAVSPVTVVVGADSLNDADTTPNATTTDLIYPAAAQFGDSTAGQGATDNTPMETVTPYANYGAPRTSPDGTDGTAVFPMDLVNNGQYNDTFVLSATVAGMTGATVKYFDATTGVELPKNADGKYVTQVVGANTEYKVLAVIDVPVGTANGDYTVSQTATGYYSAIAMSDTNNVIRVARPGALAVAKFIAKAGAPAETFNGIDGGTGYTTTSTAAGGATTAKPGQQISYKIIAKNSYPMAVKSMSLSDVVPANTTFVSATVAGVTGAQVLYKTSAGGAWSATAPIKPADVYAVAVDLNGDGALTAADELASGAQVTLNLTVEIK
ncbi:hypothetical protein [Deinococcus navajonensis]|uniref:Repeat protein (TIGR01451 family) n=1 Tax=Deinococcus navajonensis TaxID=309884 RepID=A0ABV8XT90_9DEIO